MMDSEMDQLEIDTKGLCLLCLRDTTTTEDNENQDRERVHHHHHPTTPTSFKRIMRYLSITNASQLTNLSSSSSSAALLDAASGWEWELESNAEMVVTLCQRCSPVISQLSELVKEFEVIRTRIDNCVEVVRGRVAEAEGNHALKEEFERRVTQERNDSVNNKLSAEEMSIIEDNLRMEDDENTCDSIPKGSIPEMTSRNLSVVASEDSPSSALNLLSQQPQQEETPFNSSSLLKQPTSSRMRLHHTKNATTPPRRNKSRGRSGLKSTTTRQHVVCNTCGKYFKTKRNLNNHKLIHDGGVKVKPHHDCEYCGRAFSDQTTSLQTHIVSVHTVEYHRKSLHLPRGCAHANESQLKEAFNVLINNNNNRRRNEEEFPHPHHLLRAHGTSQRKRLAQSLEGTDVDSAVAPSVSGSPPNGASSSSSRPSRTRRQSIPRGDPEWIKSLLRSTSTSDQNRNIR